MKKITFLLFFAILCINSSFARSNRSFKKNDPGKTETSTFSPYACATVITPSVTNANCPNSADGSVSLSVSGGTAPYTYSIGATATTQNITGLTPGSYTVYVEDATNCIVSAVINIGNTYSLPVVSVNSGTTCSSSPIVLSPSGASSYNWSTGSGSTNISVSPTSNTSYTVTGTDSHGCKGKAVASVTVMSLPTVSVNSGTMCTGSYFILAGGGATTYSWSTGVSAPTASVSPTTDTHYTVTGTDANGCKNKAVASVTVMPLPTISLTSGTVCPGQSITLFASGANTYTWSTFTELPSASVSPTIATTYTCTGSFLNGCSNFATTTVYVSTPPSFSLSSSTVCSGITTTLIATPISSVSSFFWSNGVNAASVAISQTATTIYTCTANSPNGCSSAMTTTLYIYPSPNLGSTSGSVCAGKPFTINANGAVSYTWSTGSNSPAITVTPSVTTSYGFSGTSVNGCINSAIVSVTVVPLPNITIPPKAICPGNSAVLIGQGGNSYVWSTGATTQSISVSPTSNTAYSCIGMAATGCSNTAVTTVTVFPAPVVLLTSASICAEQTATLSAGPANTYTWSTGNHSSSIFVVPLVTTTYTCSGLSLNNCNYISTTIVNVTAVATPVITQNGLTLTSSAAAGNQWYINGVAIPGATGQSYTATQNGNYSVIVDNGGCKSDPANMTILNTSLPGFNLKQAITLYPNPAHDFFNVSFPEQLDLSLTYHIYSSNGQLVKEEKLNGHFNTVSVEDFTTGLYLIEFSSNSYHTSFRFIKE